jgi:hypothetical protein
MQMQSTYWLEKVLKMISLYVSALLCTLQHIVIHERQISGVNSGNYASTIREQRYVSEPIRTKNLKF